ncbi:MAG TPA: UDP-N-acetylmuramoyl-tripeptide--D-alanyl-D-alanine ligase [Candidatus Aminicenantes bacterium]|nr:UDP-N-acetylmuramoyl-tripeptide--D-alanyl-D-alanine ligase [Candidatus Aminicenantes bacterium]
MAALRLDEIARLAGGTVVQGPAGRVFTGFGIDSRRAAAGDLFFAIPAERDGHDYVAAAAAAGAAGAVVSRPVDVPDRDFGVVRVGDTVAALQALAAAVLAREKARVVAVTGSVGKTTTKEFAAALLSRRFRVLKSGGNYNNRLGLALSLLGLEPGDEVAVLEMGMSAAGEIRDLARVAPPDVAVVTNIAPVHLQFFDGLEAIARAKKEILDGARPGATAVLNADDPLVMGIAAGFDGRKLTFGRGPEADVAAEAVEPAGAAGFALRLRYGRERVETPFPFPNEAAVDDLLAAAAVSLSFGLGFEEVRPAVAGLRPLPRRGALVEAGAGLLVCDDSYNSNPRALDSALKSLGARPAARKVAVLGDMLELGEGAAEFHRRAGETVARTGWDVLVAVGPLASLIADGAVAAGLGAAAVHRFIDAAAAAPAVAALVRAGDLVLVKGSRGMRTETVVDALAARRKE